MPANANALADGAAAHARPLDHRDGSAWPYRMRCRARELAHPTTSISRTITAGDRVAVIKLIRGGQRAGIYNLHSRTPDIDRARI